MTQPCFSVVIPAYNRAHLIKRTIDSVLNQSFQDFEIIVVDDGSKDNTVEVVSKINDKRIRVVTQPNSGASVARNTGITHATGKYVSFLDSDDEWLPLMLEKQLDLYNKDGEVGCVYSNVSVVRNEKEPIPFHNKFYLEGNIYAEILKQGYMAPTSAVSIRRDCFDIIEGFDPTLPASQDDDLCFKVTKHYKVALIKESMVIMHVDTSSTAGRISNSMKRVANGWWMLWNKYEHDILQYCGKDVMLDHYMDCIIRLAKASEMENLCAAIEKYKGLGGRISPIKLFLINRLANSNGSLHHVYCRTYDLYKRIFK